MAEEIKNPIDNVDYDPTESLKNRSIELCTRVVTTESFIAEARHVYGNHYDYSKVNYINSSNKVTIGCPIHGDFEIYAREHLDGKGCPRCAKGEKFVVKLKEKFGEKFGLERFKYIDSQTPVELICLKHGSFMMSPTRILTSPCGCPECGNERIVQMRDEARIAKEEIKRSEREDDINRFIEEVQNLNKRYFSGRDLSNYFDLLNMLLRLDTRSLKKLIRELAWELENRPKSLRTRTCVCSGGSFEPTTFDSFVAIDFETFYAQRVSACSVGMVKFINGQIVDKYYSLIQPPFNYPGRKGDPLTWIHGITYQMLSNERTFDQVLPEIEQFVGELPMVAHNSSVEKACIRDASAYYGLNTTLNIERIYDTLPLSYYVESKIGNEVYGEGTHSLDAVCRRFGVDELKHHNAYDDAEMCGSLFLKFHQILNEGEIIEILPSEEIVGNVKIRPEDKVQRNDLENVIDNPFKSQTIVLTGFAKADSQKYAHKLNELGAIIRDSVNKSTNILITGNNAGPSKLKKAEEFGVRIMPEDELNEIINGL